MAVAYQLSGNSNPLHLRDLRDALEMRRRMQLELIETQSVQAIRLVPPVSPYVTQPIPLSELMPWESKPVLAPVPKPKTTNKMLPLDDLGRPFVRVTEPEDIDTAALARKAIERYVHFEGKHPFVLVFCQAIRYLHIHKPFMTINGACIPCMYEPGEGDYDVMARG